MNFCAACLDPVITTNKPEADGREVINLISSDPNVRKNGYMGEYFIRPPADITIGFKVPIDVSHMKLNIKLERKCSTGFAVFTHTEDPSGTAKPGENVGSSSSATSSRTNTHASAIPGSTPLNQESQDNKIIDNDVYYCVGNFYTQSEDCLILKNHHYRHWIKVKMPEIDKEMNGLSVSRGALKHANRLALRCVKKLVVRIFRTISNTPPVLQGIEIWGQPGISTKKALTQELIGQWHGRANNVDSLVAVPRMYNSAQNEDKQNPSEEGSSASPPKDTLEIPEDFLDPLTCEIMTVPLLMPSGHSIDADTLDKYIANEAIWGRPSSDPFTGVPFKHGQMPYPNVPLKARIDRYILLNAAHPKVQSCGRTLATASHVRLRGFGSISNHNRWQTSEPNVDHAKRGHNEGSVGEMGIYQDCKRSKNCAVDKDITDVSKSEASVSSQHKVADHIRLNKSPNDARSIRGSSHLHIAKLTKVHASKPSGSSLQQRPSSGHHGLVQMIGSALSYTRQKDVSSKLPSKRPPSLIQGDAKPKPVDAMILASKNTTLCNCGENKELYSLPCNHILCRKCLVLQLDKTQVKCGVCEESCKRAEVTKYHHKSIFSVD